MAENSSLGDRMKAYEAVTKTSLVPRMPFIIRVDGKAFHTYTRNLSRPFDSNFESVMDHVALKLCDQIQGAVLAYIQSDEISILGYSYRRFSSQCWFGGEVQKMVSVSAAIASSEFTARSGVMWEGSIKPACFDSRVFVVPEGEVVNYFVWRQQDAVRNSIQSLAQSLYSHKELHKKNSSELQEMCFQKGHNWNDLTTRQRRGRCVKKLDRTEEGVRPHWGVDSDIPRFGQDREYISTLLVVEDE